MSLEAALPPTGAPAILPGRSGVMGALSDLSGAARSCCSS